MFKDLLKGKLKELDLNYETASQKTGISPVYLSLLGRGKRLPSDKVAIQLAQRLGADKDEWLKAIFQEKAKSPEVKKFFHTSFPELRKILLDLYSPKYSEYGKDYASKKEMKDELERASFHYIEEVLFDHAHENLKSKKAINQSSKEPSEEYFDHLSPSKSTDLIKKVFSEWAYNKKMHFILVATVRENGRMDCSQLKLEWVENKQFKVKLR